jgi:NAD+ synthetase
MKVYNDKFEPLHRELSDRLMQFRDQRQFDVSDVFSVKVKLLNNYMRSSNLSGCVVGISGGIDSAVVLSLVVGASEQPDSPIKKIIPLLLPALKTDGVTGQSDSLNRGLELCKHTNLQSSVVRLDDAFAFLKDAVDDAVGIKGDAWASGQLVPYLRTPALYYTTSLLNQAGFPSIVVGTTNRDEGAYLGYFGKASDGMVDVQLISDLHKSEIYKLADYLGDIPNSIFDTIPTGDMFDGRVDEEVFGAPYAFVELYITFLNLTQDEKNVWITSLSSVAFEQFSRLSRHLDKLHRYNAHKYAVGSPAVHLDAYESKCLWGWNHTPRLESREPKGLVGEIEIKLFNFDEYPILTNRRIDYIKDKERIDVINSVLTKDEIKSLTTKLNNRTWVPVGVNGRKDSFDASKNSAESIGSWRCTLNSQKFADKIWERMSPHLGGIETFEENAATDIDGSITWIAYGISPVLRFIKYEKSGVLIPHYDSPFIYNKNYRTLKSVVIYLTEPKNDEGATRFINDINFNVPLSKRNLEDKTEVAKNEDVILRVSPDLGSALVFNHRILHDSEPVITGKCIIRADIIYRRVA